MTRSIIRSLSLLILATAVFTLVGCNKDVKPAGLPKLYPCKITIIQGGQPLAGATVTLFSADGTNSKWSVSARTDETGVASMNTYGKFKGAPNGDWIVTVQKSIDEDEQGNVVVKKTLEPGEPTPPANPHLVYVISTVPLKYTDVATTDLTLTTNGKTETQIDVGEAVHEQSDSRIDPF